MHTNKHPSIYSFICIILFLLLLSGCGKSSQTNPQPATPQEQTIVDMSEKTVKVPGTINKIVITCYGGATHEVVALGGADKIAAQPSMERFNTLSKMYPGFKNVPFVGSFDDVNVEEVIKIKPDVVISGKGAKKGNKLIEDVGIPVVTVSTGLGNIEDLKKEFKMIGDLLGKPEKADELISYWDKHLQLINERVAKIPMEKKKRVYYALGNLLHTNGSAYWGQHLITAAGGINAAQDLDKAKDLNIEQVINWNPDVMILSSNEGKFITIEDIKNNPQLRSIKAVQDNQLYLCPIGTFWWDRPAPEAILGITWLAKTLYPDTFKDIDIVKETKDFYQKFYSYTLTDQEINDFLNPKP
ncbi:MAG: ABC transporter substrate-binding protein [Clostridia bacterium]|nr:ABC transporter substrate-binding protein [Clostridia bacterium]